MASTVTVITSSIREKPLVRFFVNISGLGKTAYLRYYEFPSDAQDAVAQRRICFAKICDTNTVLAGDAPEIVMFLHDIRLRDYRRTRRAKTRAQINTERARQNLVVRSVELGGRQVGLIGI